MSDGEQQLKFFNAYYIEFLKTINDISKSKKESDNKETAVKICKAVKKQYRKMDQLSPTYLNELNKSGIWEKYNALENKEIFTDEFKEIIKATKWTAFQTDWRMFRYFNLDFYTHFLKI